MTYEPNTAWEDHLWGVLLAIRFLPTRSHGLPPFSLVFKQEPLFPSVVVPPPSGALEKFWASEAEEARLADELMLRWLQIKP